MRRINIPEILYHPAFISLILWLIMIIFIPFSVSRYKIKSVSEEIYPSGLYTNFYDLDTDGSSEKISIDLNDLEQTKIIVYKNDKVMDQYNVAYQPSDIRSIYFGDYNGDTFKEIYVFTMSDDALFLSVLDPLAQRKALVYNRLIDNWEKAAQSTDRPQFVAIGMTPVSSLQSGDFIFYISAGYSLQPRNLYRYIIAGDSLIKSPESYATIANCVAIERTGSTSENTFLLSTQATGNFDETAPFTDRNSWLMVLNEDMKFTFDPVGIGRKPSRIMAIPVNLRGRTMYLLMHDYFGAEDIESMYYIYDDHGNKIKEKVIEDYEPVFSYILPDDENERKSFYLIKNHNTVVEQLDTSFNTVQTYAIPPLAYGKPFACLDADLDESNEFFFVGREQNSIVICQSDFKGAVEYRLDDGTSSAVISQVLTRGSKPLLHIQLQTHGWFLSYEKNPLHYLMAPLYLVSYFIIFLFIGLIYRIQKHRLDLKTSTEREIASLQMKAIKNQIDPHFTLNVLNSIGSLYLTEENRHKADYIFGKYASLIRQTVISSDKIIVSLDEEIEFVKNYLDIERFRFGNNFDYSIDTDPGVDMEVRIPRMLIHTFVENSIKYGLRKRPEAGGLLRIEIRQYPGLVRMTVEDNGPGLADDGISSGGTGKGMKIINDLTGLYYRLEKIRITSSLNNITGEAGEILGTRAVIELPNP